MNLLKIEIRKAFRNRQFVIAVSIAAVLCFLSALYNVQRYQEEMSAFVQFYGVSPSDVNPQLPLNSLFNHWICEDFVSLASSLFFLIFPILSSLAYGWSLYLEKKSGYIKNVMTRTKKRTYYLSKYTAVFLSGGCVVALPVILNFLIVALFIPAVTPDIYYDTGWTVRTPSMFSVLFYSRPFLYSFLRTLFVFLFGGAISVLSFSLGFFVRSRIAVVLLPFLCVLGLHFGQNLIPEGMIRGELSPIYIISASGSRFKILWVALLELGILLLITLLPAIYKGATEDVF